MHQTHLGVWGYLLVWSLVQHCTTHAHAQSHMADGCGQRWNRLTTFNQGQWNISSACCWLIGIFHTFRHKLTAPSSSDNSFHHCSGLKKKKHNPNWMDEVKQSGWSSDWYELFLWIYIRLYIDSNCSCVLRAVSWDMSVIFC